MNIESFPNSYIDVVLGSPFIETNTDREGTTRNLEDRCTAEELTKSTRVHRCACNDNLQVTTTLSDLAT